MNADKENIVTLLGTGGARMRLWAVTSCTAILAMLAFGGSAEAGTSVTRQQAPATPASNKSLVDLASSDLRAVVLKGKTSRGTQQSTSRQVVVEVLFPDGKGAEARAAIQSVGGSPGVTVPGELVQAMVPVNALESLEAKTAVTFIRPPLDYNEPLAGEETESLNSPITAGSLAGEQILKTNADAWHAVGITGAGVKVGIIDYFGSLFYNASRNAGDIPNVSGTFCQLDGGSCQLFGSGDYGDHGIAVAEAVYDMAPSAQMYFATVNTAADTQAAMNYFASQGVKVVTRSTTGKYDGPGNGTGPIASVIQNSAVNQGMFYLNAAGNAARGGGLYGSYYRGQFTDTDGDGFHEFAAGDELMSFDCGYMSGLRWSDWGEGTQATDYDAYVYDKSLNLVYESEDVQGGAGQAEPLEVNGPASDCGNPGEIAYLQIKRYAANGGDANDTLEFMTNASWVEHSRDSYSASGPMSDLNSSGAVSVGAVGDNPWGTTIAPYSSRGPTNDGRIKPDLSAVACYKSLPYHPGCFNGTSSSTPVVAGAAALALSGGAANSPQTLKNFLLASTVDRGAAGPDNVYGRGELFLSSPVTLNLSQVDNNGALRSCGSTEATACSDVVRKLRVRIGGADIPNVDVLLLAWRKVNGSWVSTTAVPFQRYAINGRRTIDMNPLCGKPPAAPHSGCYKLRPGLWRFQVQVPKASNGSTAFANSGSTYLNLTEPDPAPVTLNLSQVDNNGAWRSCGSTEATACSDVVRKLRATIGGAVIPNVDLLLKAWRKVNGSWVSTTAVPFQRYAINGRRTIDMNPLCGKPPAAPHSGCYKLLAGLWRFQVQVPAASNGSTAFANSGSTYLNLGEDRDTVSPTLAKPVVALASPDSRTVTFNISASDNVGVTHMRVRATHDPDWRSWVPYSPSGTVILPDHYGAFTVWFQVKDAAGNVSSERAADNVTRIELRDTVAPSLAKPVAQLASAGSRTVRFTLSATDNVGVTQMRVRVSGEDWRSWVSYSSSGTVILPDKRGTFTVWFQVRDSAGNLSSERAANNVVR